MMALLKRSNLGVLGFLLFSLAYLIVSEVHYASSIRPTGVRTVADHFRHFGSPHQITRLKLGSRIYYELSGVTLKQSSLSYPLLALPSAPPAYVYDEEGNFVDWFSDPGDQPAYREHWPNSEAQPVELAAFQRKYGL